ncbi:hypothetical protein, variant [Exophiala xenobiotica]|uniref:Uncharacterized protein n=1 Tax=Exophiala xenobiotica TaxID=348802 RepID=A0A0D2D940_9EURO|nr:hypothetical protein, variant [Exophiala xenobiotica]XP_013319422.1 uncharacterized protein PV05_03331 [Exophiala xenobiotica]KIW58837.1 hypothetical protein PV05_03331 [Exophiala xenobiotica]KIW58838.1 hypothetical protein, variant [Exophiala xenobiotica]
MGAISSMGTSERGWGLATLDRMTQRLSMNSWAGLKERLKVFLWFEYTDDGDGFKLLIELEETSLKPTTPGLKTDGLMEYLIE